MEGGLLRGPPYPPLWGGFPRPEHKPFKLLEERIPPKVGKSPKVVEFLAKLVGLAQLESQGVSNGGFKEFGLNLKLGKLFYYVKDQRSYRH